MTEDKKEPQALSEIKSLRGEKEKYTGPETAVLKRYTHRIQYIITTRRQRNTILRITVFFVMMKANIM